MTANRSCFSFLFIVVSLFTACVGLIEPASVAQASASLPRAQAVKDEGQAVRLAASAVQRHRLTQVPARCLRFDVSPIKPDGYRVDVIEHHDESCGGDPQTGPRLFSIAIDRHTGKMTTDADHAGEFRPLP